MYLKDIYQCDIEGVELAYDLLAERPKENWISHNKMPSFAEHVRFMDSKPFRYWYVIILDNGEMVGTIECLPTNEFGIHILKQYHRKGYGTEAVKLFLDTHVPLPAIPAVRNGKWLSNMTPSNHASKEFFGKLGFRPLQETWVYE